MEITLKSGRLLDALFVLISVDYQQFVEIDMVHSINEEIFEIENLVCLHPISNLALCCDSYERSYFK